MKPKSPKDPLKAARKGSREAEIEMHGHPLPKHKIHKSKKQYNRKNAKVSLNDKDEPLVLSVFDANKTQIKFPRKSLSHGR